MKGSARPVGPRLTGRTRIVTPQPRWETRGFFSNPKLRQQISSGALLEVCEEKCRLNPEVLTFVCLVVSQLLTKRCCLSFPVLKIEKAVRHSHTQVCFSYQIFGERTSRMTFQNHVAASLFSAANQNESCRNPTEESILNFICDLKTVSDVLLKCSDTAACILQFSARERFIGLLHETRQARSPEDSTSCRPLNCARAWPTSEEQIYLAMINSNS